MLNAAHKEYLDQISQKVRQGNVALFLGAGASCCAGGPGGDQLAKMVKERFPKVNQSSDNLLEIFQDVLETPGYSRNELEEFLRTVLEPLQPTEDHRSMTKYDWAAVFTTNYDDLIEVAYRTTPQRLKRGDTIYTERFHVNLSDRSRVYIFKMMGSMQVPEGESGCMVLSQRDYRSALVRRKKYLELLFDFIKSGTMVFVGYSFRDRLVLDIVDDYIEIYGKERLPWSYACFEEIPLDEKSNYMFSSRKIIPLKCGFGDFFEYLGRNCAVAVKNRKSVGVKLRGYYLEVTEDKRRQLAEYFDFLNEERINEDAGKRDDFFMGINKTEGGFREGWDFCRDLYNFPGFKRILGGRVVSGCLRDRVFEELRKFDVDNKVILVTGMAGVGKTMLLRRLAYDVYTSGESPVIFIQRARTSLDYKSLAGFIEELNDELIQRVGQDQPLPRLKPLIIIDDAASMIRHVNRIKDFLASRGIPAVIVGAERTGEWMLQYKAFPFRISEENVYELDEKLTEREKARVVDHLYGLGYLVVKGISWDGIVSGEFENSFFATMYTLVHPARKPLGKIIQDQYQNLTDVTQKAFRNICLFHQFGLPINIELLVRSLGVEYGDFCNNVLSKDAAKVIFEERDEEGNMLYRTHHRIIAERTVQSFFGDPQEQSELFIEILSQAHLENRKEYEICEKLVIGYIGPGANNKIFSYDQQKAIFETICGSNSTRSLVHHWGILEMEQQNYAEARRLFEKALRLDRQGADSYRGESTQNILTSLGSLYSHWGLALLSQGDREMAEENFREAESCFIQARHVEFPNAHAYHAHALMRVLIARRTADEAEKLNEYAEALEILGAGRDNLNDDDLQPMYELEAQIWEEADDEEKVEECVGELRDRFKSSRGYYLCAQLLWHKAHGVEGQERQRLSESALRRIEEGLKIFPRDEHCLGLRAKLLKELEPNNPGKYYEALRQWKGADSRPNAWLLYELGRTAFILDYYDASNKAFAELETGVGVGHRLRSRSRYPILDEQGKKKEFEGRVVRILSRDKGEIRCDSLRSLRYTIPFRLAACRLFTPSSGDVVKFNIEFNYRGALGVDVRRM